jgi:L-threonylcarbamoyladenylate synthase
MVILEKLPLVPDIITGGSATVGIRVPSHPVAMALLELLDDPVAATSANISGSPAGATIDHILEDLAGKVQVALESAEPLLGIESTIIDMTRREPVILRRGFISPDEIASVLGTAPLMTESPGRKLFPAGTTCIFVEGDREGIAGEMEKIIDESPGVSIGILASTELAPHLPRVSFTGVLGSADNPQEIARNFLVRMRQIIDAGVGLILIEGIRGEGPAHAVMERLRAGADEIRRSGAPKS